MIPYEDLVAALASWRARNGLPTGPADYLGEPPPAQGSFAASFDALAAPPPAQDEDGYAQDGYAQDGYAQNGYAQDGYAQDGHAEESPPAGDEIVDLSEDSGLLDAAVVEESPVDEVMPEEIYDAEEADADYVVPFPGADEPAAVAGASPEEEGGEEYDLGVAEGMVEEEYSAPDEPSSDAPAPPPPDPTAQMWTGDIAEPPLSEPPLADPPPVDDDDDDDPERQGS